MRIILAVAFAALATAPALAQDLFFTLANDSSYSIVEMYVSPVGEAEWGENILLVDEWASGLSGEVFIMDGLDVCEYDLQFVTAEGIEVTQTQDLCVLTTFTITD